MINYELDCKDLENAPPSTRPAGRKADKRHKEATRATASMFESAIAHACCLL